MSKTLYIRCTKCGCRATVRTSKEQTRKFRVLYCICNNAECAHSFAVNMEFSHTISPSALDMPQETRERIKNMDHQEQQSLFSLLTPG